MIQYIAAYLRDTGLVTNSHIQSLPGSSSDEQYRTRKKDEGNEEGGKERSKGKGREGKTGENDRILNSLRAGSARLGAERSAGREMMLGATLALSRNRSTYLPGGRQAGRHASIRQSVRRCLKRVAQCCCRRNVELFPKALSSIRLIYFNAERTYLLSY